MAIFKVATDPATGEKKIYDSIEQVENLIHYICRDSIMTELNNLFPLTVDNIINQMLYIQSCKGGRLSTRALHYILSFDTDGWEREIGTREIYDCLLALHMSALPFGINEHQCIACLHDKPGNKHLHIVINPVNMKTNKILHITPCQYQFLLKDFARNLYMRYRIALQGVSYVREDGAFSYSDGTHFLYENRTYVNQSMFRN